MTISLTKRLEKGRQSQQIVSENRKQKAIYMHGKGYITSYIARTIGVSERQIQRYLKDEVINAIR